MNCKKCGKTLMPQESFCTLCGYYNERSDDEEKAGAIKVSMKTAGNLEVRTFDDDDDDDANYSYGKNSKRIDTLKYIRVYLGEDYDIVTKSNFNLYALLLSWIYVLYKKMYIIGILGLIIVGVLLLTSIKLLIAFLLISMITLGFTFNSLYKWSAKTQVERVLNKFYDKTEEQKLDICYKKGNGNVIVTLFIYFAFLVTIFGFYISQANNRNFNDKFWKENGSNRATCLSMLKAAYNVSKQRNAYRAVEEGGCEVVNAKEAKYYVYLKLSTNTQSIYEQYRTENNELFFEATTELLIEYENKKLTKGLSTEEQEYYSEMLKLQSDYENLRYKSQEEDRQINSKTNVYTKSFFLIQGKEIER